jgi:hypothetical protein
LRWVSLTLPELALNHDLSTFCTHSTLPPFYQVPVNHCCFYCLRNFFILVFLFVSFFYDSVSLCSPSWTQTNMPLASGSWELRCLHSFVFSRESYSWNHVVCHLCKMATFPLHGTCSSINFLGFIAHFILPLVNILLCRYSTVSFYPFIYFLVDSWFGNYE